MKSFAECPSIALLHNREEHVKVSVVHLGQIHDELL